VKAAEQTAGPVGLLAACACVYRGKGMHQRACCEMDWRVCCIVSQYVVRYRTGKL
jgi:hypothetical protein